MTRQSTRPARPDPRVVGGVYWCGYWQQHYTVLEITAHPDWRGLSWYVQDENGYAHEHSTPWDWKYDQIVYQPYVCTPE